MAGKTVKQLLVEARDMLDTSIEASGILREEIRELKEDRANLAGEKTQLREDLNEARRELRAQEIKAASMGGYIERCHEYDKLWLIEKGRINLKDSNEPNTPSFAQAMEYGHGFQTGDDWRYR